MAIRTAVGTFVGPDNGVFSLVLASVDVLEAVVLSNTAFQLKRVSSTFHGRDIFAPAAAHLAAGVKLNDLGPPATDLVRSDFQSGDSAKVRLGLFILITLGI